MQQKQQLLLAAQGSIKILEQVHGKDPKLVKTSELLDDLSKQDEEEMATNVLIKKAKKDSLKKKLRRKDEKVQKEQKYFATDDCDLEGQKYRTISVATRQSKDDMDAINIDLKNNSKEQLVCG